MQIATPKFRGPFVAAMAWTGVIAVLSCLVLDGGETARLSLTAILIFWAAALVVFYRRRENPTQADLSLTQWGCPLLVLIFNVTTHIVWSWRGLE